MRKASKDPMAWRQSPDGRTSYDRTRAEAQAKANETGYDYGLEANDLFRSWNYFMLPGRKYRSGHELRCEVVSCESWERMQPGHGGKE